MSRIRTIICDDEPEAREGLLDLVRGDAEIDVVGEARNGAEVVSIVLSQRPELMFLDVQMPELDGFEALGALSSRIGSARLPIVVFVSAYDEFALRAFEVHALDYLLKPFSDARFTDAARIAKDRVRQRRAGVLAQQLASLFGEPQAGREVAGTEVLPPAPAHDAEARSAHARYRERIPVRIGQKIYFVPVDDIDWIEADGYYAKLHVSGRTYLVRETLTQLAAELEPTHFVRVHRSAIVNVRRVTLMQPYFGGAHVITLSDGTQVPLSRTRLDEFQRALGSRSR